MKVCIVGKSPMEFTASDTGEVIEGVKVYYYAPKDEVEGFFAGELWVKKSSKLYNKVLGLDTEKPFMADVEYDMQPGKKRPMSVMMNIRALSEDELVYLADNPFWQNCMALFVA